MAVREPAACRVAVRSAHDAARAEIARAQLTIMPLDQFKDAFPKRVRDGRGSAQPDAGQLWADYLARPAAYHGLLREAAGLAPDEASIQRYPLDLSLVTARLRGHQASGASFALIQERAIIGDERRLGKTVTALAAMAHLAAGGATHFFVICPANAVAYWTRETGRHTRLVAHRLHGSERFSAWQRWLAEGGVAVASFSVLSYQPRLPPEAQLAMLTVDEAHYTKNPDTDRTRAVLAWIAATPRTLLLTSAPLESKPAELCVLIGHLRPDLAKRLTPIAGILGAEGLRQAVAPVYLRRTESDLVDDLPPLSALPTPRDGLPTAGSRRSAR